jgi:CBS-domain-containing membrane protein
MNISDVCIEGVWFCRPNDPLATAAGVMWHHNCGAVPVLDEADRLVGVVTDRDLAIAMATRGWQASQTSVGEVMSGSTVSCRYRDSVREVLRIMRDTQLRRLPVLDERGALTGMVSVKDIIRSVQELPAKATREGLLQEVILTLMSISQHHTPNTLELAESRAMIPGV